MNPTIERAFAQELLKIAELNPEAFADAMVLGEKHAGLWDDVKGAIGLGGEKKPDVFQAAKQRSAGEAASHALTHNMGGSAVDPFAAARKAPVKMPAKIPFPKHSSALTAAELAKLAATLVNPAMAKIFHGAPAALSPKAIAGGITGAARPAMPAPAAAAPAAGGFSRKPADYAAAAPKTGLGALAAQAGQRPAGFSRSPASYASPGAIAPGGAGAAAAGAVRPSGTGQGGLFNAPAHPMNTYGGGTPFTDHEMIVGRGGPPPVNTGRP